MTKSTGFIPSASALARIVAASYIRVSPPDHLRFMDGETKNASGPTGACRT